MLPQDAEKKEQDAKIQAKEDAIENETEEPAAKEPLRNLIAYWILGMANNYGYVIMLCAANDILDKQENSDSIQKGIFRNSTDIRDCNLMSTGAILLADILPCLLIKLIGPFLPFFINIRVGICIILAAAGLLTVAFSVDQWMSILGVVFTSFASGLGEQTYLQYSSYYDKNVVSTWSSGTGGAGVLGAISYAALNSLGLQTALLIMLIVPAAMGVAFWGLLSKPTGDKIQAALQRAEDEELHDPKGSIKKKLHLLPGLLKYMIPLGLVYLFEYFINQGMFELINFENISIIADDQYRWLQVIYQVGVFISRSSVNIIHIKRIWLMSVFQLINVFIFTSEVIFYYMPSFWIIVALTLWEGVLGGAAYVNTFYKISSDVREEDKTFSMGVTSFADSIGITFAGVFAMLAHNAICELPKPERLL